MPGYRVSVRTRRPCLLPSLLVLLAATAAAALVTVVWWKAGPAGPGLSLNSGPALLAWHPVLATAGLLLLGAAAAVHRLPGPGPGPATTAAHATAMLVGAAGQAGGFVTAWLAREKAAPHLNSLHSWLGLASLGCLALQLPAGLLVSLLPCPGRLRAQYRPLHTFTGLTVVAGLAATALTGLAGAEQETDSVIIINSAGIFLAVFTITVILITTKPSFKPLD